MDKDKMKSIRTAWKLNFRTWNSYRQLYPRAFAITFLDALLNASLPLVTIWFSAQLLNELSGNRNVHQLTTLVWMILGVGAALGLLSAVVSHYKAYQQEISSFFESKLIMKKYLSMDFINVDDQKTYDLYSKILQIENMNGRGVWDSIKSFEKLIKASFQILGAVLLSVSLFVQKVPNNDTGLAFLNHPVFIVLILFFMILVSILAPMCFNKEDACWANYSETGTLGNRYYGYFLDICFNRKKALDFRTYRQYRNCRKQYQTGVDSSFGINSPIAKAYRGSLGLWMMLGEVISVSLTGIIYLFVCLKSWAGAFGVGSVTQYIGAITNLFLGISALLENIGRINNNRIFLQDFYKLIDLPNTMYQGSLTTEKRSDRQYDIEFKDVSFRYPGSEIYALRHVNLKFKVGSRMAVVGKNGSGKTTFIKLLCRLYDPTEGEILLNGINIRKYRYDDYMSIFSVVFQDFKLLDLPLGENVAASQDFDEAKVNDCLQKAGFGDRLQSMPNGLKTYLYKDLDSEGVEISGGEAQKIAIARSLYRDAPFIILDKPTAALDPIAESEIYSKFNEIAGDKTAIYISHRLSSCKFCDEIAVFDNGSVVQYGTHDSLIAEEGGTYQILWNAQAQYYAKKEQAVS